MKRTKNQTLIRFKEKKRKKNTKLYNILNWT